MKQKMKQNLKFIFFRSLAVIILLSFIRCNKVDDPGGLFLPEGFASTVYVDAIEEKVRHMIVNDKGDFSGSVSGGCVETSVVRECISLIKEKKLIKKIEFKVSNESAWEVGLACGGEIAVYLEQIN